MDRSLFTLILCALTISAHAQTTSGFTCATQDEHILEGIHQNDPLRIAEIRQAERDLEEFAQEFTADNYGRAAGTVYIIPIVFHVIHNNGPENISDAQIEDAVRVLNRDMRKLNPDTASIVSAFASIAADVEIEFRLAQLDPNGNCTKGINRVESTLTHSGDQDMKDLIQWPRNQYLNVWTCAFANGAAGYTNYPSSVSGNWGAAADGIVLLHDYTGSIGTGSDSRSRTLTHEVGHWINLPHVWGSTNQPGLASNCSSDDSVNDTPNTIGWTYCNLTGQSCGSPDNVQNYMEYSYCSRMFTEGQKQRMRASLISSTAQRDQLSQASNLVATGTAGPDILCDADFTASHVTLCAGDSIQFIDGSYHGVIQWNWSFQGGAALSTSVRDPWVTYTVPGVYDVSLTASNASGIETETKIGYITVLPATGAVLPFQEGFESIASLPNAEWVITNDDQNATFDINTAASFSGAQSVFINNYLAVNGDLDEMISTTIDLSTATDATITFRHAFARRSSTNDDRLRVYVSKNCGDTWLLRDQLRGQTNLATVPDQNTLFVPNSTSDWQFTSIDNIPADYYVSDFRMKFWFQSNGGNNIYLDDINITSINVGVGESAIGVQGATLVPNPATDATELVLQLQQAGTLIVDLMDVTGRHIMNVTTSHAAQGELRVPIGTDRLQAGIYYVRSQVGGETGVLRLVKE